MGVADVDLEQRRRAIEKTADYIETVVAQAQRTVFSEALLKELHACMCEGDQAVRAYRSEGAVVTRSWPDGSRPPETQAVVPPERIAADMTELVAGLNEWA